MAYADDEFDDDLPETPQERFRRQLDESLERSLAARHALKQENIERLYSRKQMEQGFLECFELVGGVPRLAMWANDPKNYGEFLKLLIKFAPKEAEKATGTVINYMSSIPDSALNSPQPDHLQEGSAMRVGFDGEGE